MRTFLWSLVTQVSLATVAVLHALTFLTHFWGSTALLIYTILIYADTHLQNVKIKMVDVCSFRVDD